MERRLIVLAALGMAALPALAGGGGAVVLKATLSGTAEWPKGAPNGSGTATIRVDGAKVCWTLKVSGTDKPLAAHIHKGGPSLAGPVVIPLGKAYKASGCATSAAAVTRALVKSPAGYYVNVHTKRYPAGAVRGQLKAAGASTGGYGSGDSSGDTSGGYGGYGDTNP